MCNKRPTRPHLFPPMFSPNIVQKLISFFYDQISQNILSEKITFYLTLLTLDIQAHFI